MVYLADMLILSIKNIKAISIYDYLKCTVRENSAFLKRTMREDNMWRLIIATSLAFILLLIWATIRVITQGWMGLVPAE